MSYKKRFDHAANIVQVWKKVTNKQAGFKKNDHCIK
jgi:hypothetical protein